jgi:hypothetical protein
MIAIGIILSFISLVFLCWLLFALAVQALPVFLAFAAGLAAYHSGSGEIGAFLVGLIAGACTLAAGQIAVAAFRSPVIRTAIALVFAVPVAMAGYHAALGLAQLGVPAELWQQAFAVIGAVAVGATASILSAFEGRPTVNASASRRMNLTCDQLGLRGCGFFTVREGRISFQRGYWDKLSFLKMHGLPLE